jgi:hypothetical protein
MEVGRYQERKTPGKNLPTRSVGLQEEAWQQQCKCLIWPCDMIQNLLE